MPARKQVYSFSENQIEGKMPKIVTVGAWKAIARKISVAP